MCDVHLVPFRVFEGVPNANSGTLMCSSCGDPLGILFTEVRGVLDDGTPGWQLFHYHPDCWEFIDDEYDPETGCFSYGTPFLVFG